MKAYRVANAREIRQVWKITFEKIFLGPSQPYDNCGCHTDTLAGFIYTEQQEHFYDSCVSGCSST